MRRHVPGVDTALKKLKSLLRSPFKHPKPDIQGVSQCLVQAGTVHQADAGKRLVSTVFDGQAYALQAPDSDSRITRIGPVWRDAVLNNRTVRDKQALKEFVEAREQAKAAADRKADIAAKQLAQYQEKLAREQLAALIANYSSSAGYYSFGGTFSPGGSIGTIPASTHTTMSPMAPAFALFDDASSGTCKLRRIDYDVRHLIWDMVIVIVDDQGAAENTFSMTIEPEILSDLCEHGKQSQYWVQFQNALLGICFAFSALGNLSKQAVQSPYTPYAQPYTYAQPAPAQPAPSTVGPYSSGQSIATTTTWSTPDLT